MAGTRTAELRDRDRDDLARRGARRCVPPLALLALVFVLPTVRACDRNMSPLELGLKVSPIVFMAWPMFAIAAGLACLVLVQPRLRGPLLQPTRGVLAAPVLTWLSCIFPAFVMADDWARSQPRAQEWIVAAVALLVALPLSIVAFVRAVRAANWRRERYAIASFAAAAWLTYPAQVIFADLFDPRERPGLRWGAYVFAVALVWLSVAAARRDNNARFV